LEQVTDILLNVKNNIRVLGYFWSFSYLSVRTEEFCYKYVML
jgi:hypothetical protein